VGNGGTRTLVPGDVYTIILTNSGGTSISRTIESGTASFSVQPGPWDILVRAVNGNELRALGRGDVEVKVGATVNASITIVAPYNINLNKGTAWGDLQRVIEKTDSEFIMLSQGTLTSNEEDTYIEIPIGKNVTLLAASGGVRIEKTAFDTYSLFRVPSGSSLTLGVAGGMPGAIIIDGSGSNPNDNSSLIFVGRSRFAHGPQQQQQPDDPNLKGGILTMYDGVTLTKNKVAGSSNSNRGGAVVVQGGTFDMRGGIISRNAATYGGGVLVLSGTFTKTGGIIYGSDGGEESNKAAKDGQGHAVYYDTTKQSIDSTF
jgi:hypothetical protein